VLVRRARARRRRAGLDPIRHVVTGAQAGAAVATEYRMLAGVVSRAASRAPPSLISSAWAPGCAVGETLDSYVTRLRGAHARRRRQASVVTVRGVGYRLDASAGPRAD